MVDDSIVRGTTTRAMVAMLREAGAAEVHLRISSPPYRWPCFYGMDTGARGELLAANMTVDEIRDYLNVDSLAYLTLDRLIERHRRGRAPASATPASPATTRSTVPVEPAARACSRSASPTAAVRSVGHR